jgi:Caspase domain
MRTLLYASLLVSLVLGGLGVANAEKRVALVIGNGAYRNVPALLNPVHDADDIAAALDRMGFSVQKLSNADFDEMRRAHHLNAKTPISRKKSKDRQQPRQQHLGPSEATL